MVTDAIEVELREQLFALPGVERVLWAGVDLGIGELTASGTCDQPTRAWARILAATTARMSEELDYGPPRMLTISYDTRLLALAIDPLGAVLAVVTSNPSSLGLIMVKLRVWLVSRLERWSE